MAAIGNGNGNGNGNGANGTRGAGLASLADRLPPQNLEAELGVLGSILLDNEVLHDIIPILTPDDFYRDTHQTLYRTVRELYDLGKPVDTITLAEELQHRGQYDRIGGDDVMMAVANGAPHAANAKYYAGIVREKSVQRQIIAIAGEMLQEGYSNLHTADDLLQQAERRIFRIAEEQATGDTVELRDIVVQAMDRIAQRSETKHALVGLGTGLKDLDDVTTGFQGPQLIVLAARPSMGKTALALNIAEYVALTQRKGVLVVSLEMGQMELAERFLCSRSKVEGGKVRTGIGLDSRAMRALGDAYEELRGAPIFIDDTPTRTILQISANARRIKLKQSRTDTPLGLIVVDYIQLVESEGGENRDSRQEQIAKISRRLKTLARELQVPVIALSQLNRQSETREDKRPRMADLRESGAIEQDADMVLLLHRADYYDAADNPGIAELNVAKNRNGRTDTIRLQFQRNIMKFHDLSPMHDGPGGGPF